MKRLLFLDIDGVLNTFDYIKIGKGYIDPEKINLLNELSEKEVEVVISSSWGYNEDTLSALSSLNLSIIGGIQDEAYFSDWICRGNLIEKWIYDNIQNESYEYVILDDTDDILKRQEENFVRVDPSIGLTEDNIDRIKEILRI